MALRQPRSEDPAINLTPMIDVVFLLVIFFMVGTKFSEQEGRIPVNLPGVGQPQSMVRGPDKRVVEVTRDGAVFLDGQPISHEQLRSELQRARAAYPDLGVVVRGDAAGTLDSYAQVLSICSNSGIERLDVAVQSLR
ncbi:ExbD/TolR family protein [Candidatus Laterigemmans baculatus]|uniref:ExbD/TolR family protein n=1 Tax=Candidatus Laterigemmans baculatus TaxID=2770505 RepID=UPI0013DA1995|nr:biopolymer transporter ExbD [Candidatus Laterigemmans baculatus]